MSHYTYGRGWARSPPESAENLQIPPKLAPPDRRPSPPLHGQMSYTRFPSPAAPNELQAAHLALVQAELDWQAERKILAKRNRASRQNMASRAIAKLRVRQMLHAWRTQHERRGPLAREAVARATRMASRAGTHSAFARWRSVTLRSHRRRIKLAERQLSESSRALEMLSIDRISRERGLERSFETAKQNARVELQRSALRAARTELIMNSFAAMKWKRQRMRQLLHRWQGHARVRALPKKSDRGLTRHHVHLLRIFKRRVNSQWLSRVLCVWNRFIQRVITTRHTTIAKEALCEAENIGAKLQDAIRTEHRINEMLVAQRRRHLADEETQRRMILDLRAKLESADAARDAAQQRELLIVPQLREAIGQIAVLRRAAAAARATADSSVFEAQTKSALIKGTMVAQLEIALQQLGDMRGIVTSIRVSSCGQSSPQLARMKAERDKALQWKNSVAVSLDLALQHVAAVRKAAQAARVAAESSVTVAETTRDEALRWKENVTQLMDKAKHHIATVHEAAGEVRVAACNRVAMANTMCEESLQQQSEAAVQVDAVVRQLSSMRVMVSYTRDAAMARGADADTNLQLALTQMAEMRSVLGAARIAATSLSSTQELSENATATAMQLARATEELARGREREQNRRKRLAARAVVHMKIKRMKVAFSAWTYFVRKAHVASMDESAAQVQKMAVTCQKLQAALDEETERALVNSSTDGELVARVKEAEAARDALLRWKDTVAAQMHAATSYLSTIREAAGAARAYAERSVLAVIEERDEALQRQSDAARQLKNSLTQVTEMRSVLRAARIAATSLSSAPRSPTGCLHDEIEYSPLTASTAGELVARITEAEAARDALLQWKDTVAAQMHAATSHVTTIREAAGAARAYAERSVLAVIEERNEALQRQSGAARQLKDSLTQVTEMRSVLGAARIAATSLSSTQELSENAMATAMQLARATEELARGREREQNRRKRLAARAVVHMKIKRMKVAFSAWTYFVRKAHVASMDESAAQVQKMAMTCQKLQAALDEETERALVNSSTDGELVARVKEAEAARDALLQWKDTVAAQMHAATNHVAEIKRTLLALEKETRQQREAIVLAKRTRAFELAAKHTQIIEAENARDTATVKYAAILKQLQDAMRSSQATKETIQAMVSAADQVRVRVRAMLLHIDQRKLEQEPSIAEATGSIQNSATALESAISVLEKNLQSGSSSIKVAERAKKEAQYRAMQAEARLSDFQSRDQSCPVTGQPVGHDGLIMSQAVSAGIKESVHRWMSMLHEQQIVLDTALQHAATCRVRAGDLKLKAQSEVQAQMLQSIERCMSCAQSQTSALHKMVLALETRTCEQAMAIHRAKASRDDTLAKYSRTLEATNAKLIAITSTFDKRAVLRDARSNESVAYLTANERSWMSRVNKLEQHVRKQSQLIILAKKSNIAALKRAQQAESKCKECIKLYQQSKDSAVSRVELEDMSSSHVLNATIQGHSRRLTRILDGMEDKQRRLEVISTQDIPVNNALQARCESLTQSVHMQTSLLKSVLGQIASCRASFHVNKEQPEGSLQLSRQMDAKAAYTQAQAAAFQKTISTLEQHAREQARAISLAKKCRADEIRLVNEAENARDTAMEKLRQAEHKYEKVAVQLAEALRSCERTKKTACAISSAFKQVREHVVGLLLAIDNESSRSPQQVEQNVSYPVLVPSDATDRKRELILKFQNAVETEEGRVVDAMRAVVVASDVAQLRAQQATNRLQQAACQKDAHAMRTINLAAGIGKRKYASEIGSLDAVIDGHSRRLTQLLADAESRLVPSLVSTKIAK